MKPLTRILVGAVALVAVSMSLSACDASPYAASVNGQVIKQLTLQNRLSEFASNKAYVKAENTPSTSSSSSAASTAITGAGGSGTYTSSFAADILGQMVVESIVHQYLTHRNELPSPSMVAAARAIYEAASSSSYWYGFPPSLRDFLAQFLAEQAAVIAPSTQTATLKQGFTQFAEYMFTQVCVRQASALNGAQAESLISSGVAPGTTTCYDQAQLEAQPEGFRNAILDLSVGGITKPITTSFGFEVAKLVSKRSVPFNTDTQKVLTVIYDSDQGTALPNIDKIITSASVKVNPQYGTWQASSGAVAPPQTKTS